MFYGQFLSTSSSAAVLTLTQYRFLSHTNKQALSIAVRGIILVSLKRFAALIYTPVSTLRSIRGDLRQLGPSFSLHLYVFSPVTADRAAGHIKPRG